MSGKFEKHYLYRIYPAYLSRRGEIEKPFYVVAVSEEQAACAVRTKLAEQVNNQRREAVIEWQAMNPGGHLPHHLSISADFLPSQIDILRSERIEDSGHLLIVESAA